MYIAGRSLSLKTTDMNSIPVLVCTTVLTLLLLVKAVVLFRAARRTTLRRWFYFRQQEIIVASSPQIASLRKLQNMLTAVLVIVFVVSAIFLYLFTK